MEGFTRGMQFRLRCGEGLGEKKRGEIQAGVCIKALRQEGTCREVWQSWNREVRAPLSTRREVPLHARLRKHT